MMLINVLRAFDKKSKNKINDEFNVEKINF